jgi:Family of unknown function (DUF5681)
MSDNDRVARYQRPPRKGQFKSGQSGNPHGRPKGSRNIRTYVQRLLDAPILVKEDGKTRKISRAEAIATQLVNLAARGDPKGLAAVMSLTREYDSASADSQSSALSRAEDAAVMAGIIARIRTTDPAPSPELGLELSGLNSAEEPESSSNADADIQRTLQ